MAGTQIGSYRIERTLGTGGFGIVYVGVDVRLDRRAAVKQLLPEMSGKREIVERFFNEAKAAASINHPGIVEIYEVGWHTDGSAYFAMKLLDGDSLGKRLKKSGPMAVSLAATIGRQVSSALAAAHARGIVHRDLKPDNIILVRDDEVAIGERATVLDFGIAKLFGDKPGANKTRTGLMMGTPSYMSPEQCRGAGEVDHRTDVYALGCILFEILTGRPPFVGEGAGEILGMHQFVAPPALRSLRPDISPEFEAVVMRTLTKHPAERFPQMSELTAALQPFATGGRSMERAAVSSPPSRSGSELDVPSARALPGGDSSFSAAASSMQTTSRAAPGRGGRSRWRGIVLVSAAAAAVGVVIAIAASPSGSPPSQVAAPAAPADAQSGAGSAALAIAPSDAEATRIADTPRSESESEAALRSISEAARGKDYARAKAAFETIPETSVYHPQARSAFDSLVADHVKTVTKQARELAAARKCKELSALAQRAAEVSAAARSAVEAVPCAVDSRPKGPAAPSLAKCGFDEAVQKGDEMAAAGQYAASLAMYEKALKCKPDERLVGKAYVSACNSHNADRAKFYFRKLPASRHGQLSQVCVRNGIDPS